MDVDINPREIHECMCQAYDLGYTGLFVSDEHKCIYMQTSHSREHMSPNKVSRICSRFGNIHSAKTFSQSRSEVGKSKTSYR